MDHCLHFSGDFFLVLILTGKQWSEKGCNKILKTIQVNVYSAKTNKSSERIYGMTLCIF